MTKLTDLHISDPTIQQRLQQALGQTDEISAENYGQVVDLLVKVATTDPSLNHKHPEALNFWKTAVSLAKEFGTEEEWHRQAGRIVVSAARLQGWPSHRSEITDAQEAAFFFDLIEEMREWSAASNNIAHQISTETVYLLALPIDAEFATVIKAIETIASLCQQQIDSLPLGNSQQARDIHQSLTTFIDVCQQAALKFNQQDPEQLIFFLNIADSIVDSQPSAVWAQGENKRDFFVMIPMGVTDPSEIIIQPDSANDAAENLHKRINEARQMLRVAHQLR